MLTNRQEIEMNDQNTPWPGPAFGFRGRRGTHRGSFRPDVPPFPGAADGEDTGHRRRRPPFGPGFGPPFGPGMRGFPGPRGRLRRGRRTARGDIRAAVLALVAEQPRHGYEIIQEIAERTGGAWRPSPGSVYPTLSQLEDEGLVRVEQADGRRIVHLTEEGTRYVEERREELDAVWASVGRDADDENTVELWEQLGQLHAAAAQVMSAGTPEQIATATATDRKSVV